MAYFESTVVACFLLIVLFLGVDVSDDLSHGADLGHVLWEAGAFLISAVLLGTFLLKFANQVIQERNSVASVLQGVTAERDRWKEQSRSYLQGLGRAIDEQFRAWGLSESEKEIGLLMLKGLSHKEISKIRQTSERTVRQQAASVYAKARLENKAQLSAYFLEGLLLPKEAFTYESTGVRAMTIYPTCDRMVLLPGLILTVLLASACAPSRPHHLPLHDTRPQKLLSSSETPDDSCKHTDTGLHCVKVLSVYDGDTVFIEIPNIPPVFGKRIGVRVLGIDTPEISSKEPCERAAAKEAQQVLTELIHKAQRVDITNVQRDKYFRVLGDLLVDGERVADELLRRRLAFPYFGEKKTKRDWCAVSPRE